jgi:uncharacterized SAM-binding protein YcdF (DUF218 family)
MYHLVVAILQPFFLFFVLAVLGVVSLYRNRKVTRCGLALLAVSLTVLALACTPVVSYVARHSLESQYAPQDDRLGAEVIVVLGGYLHVPDAIRSQVELGEDTLYRCLHAVQLYRRGKPCPVILSGGKLAPEQQGPPLAKAMYDFLVQQGVAASDLIIEDQSRSTRENAVETAKILRQHGVQRIVLITEALHMPRAVRCFRAEGFVVVPSACQYRATHFDWTIGDFLPSPDGARGVQRAWHEWLGSIWYRLRYGV